MNYDDSVSSKLVLIYFIKHIFEITQPTKCCMYFNIFSCFFLTVGISCYLFISLNIDIKLPNLIYTTLFIIFIGKFIINILCKNVIIIFILMLNSIHHILNNSK